MLGFGDNKKHDIKVVDEHGKERITTSSKYMPYLPRIGELIHSVHLGCRFRIVDIVHETVYDKITIKTIEQSDPEERKRAKAYARKMAGL